MKKKLSLFLVFVLTSCSTSNVSPLDNYFSVNKDKIWSLDNDQYTQHGYLTYISDNSSYDYTLTLNDKVIPISITGKGSLKENYMIKQTPMFNFNYPSNSNMIISGENYIYFDGLFVYKFDTDFNVLKAKRIKNIDSSINGSSIFLKDDYLYLLTCYDDSTTLFKVNKETFVTVKTTKLDYSENSSKFSEVAFLNEINSFYKNDFSEFILNGYVYSMDEDEKSLYTDYFQVLSQPTFDGEKYVYKAIKIDDTKITIDFKHSLNVQSESIIKIDKSNITGFRGLVDKNGKINLFFELTTYGVLSEVYRCDYLTIDVNNSCSHQYFSSLSFYTGYVLKEDKYYFEIAKGSKNSFASHDASEYYHCVVE